MTNATQADLSAPVVLYYTEGRETYAVNAAGLIGRPAIKMPPSGGWRFTGLASGAGVRRYSFPDLIRALLGGARPLEAPSGRGLVWYALDLDHGTPRSHGTPLTGLWLAGDHGLDAPALLELVDGLDRARAERLNAAAAVAVQARLEAVRSLPVVYSEPRHGIALHRFRKRPADYRGDGAAFAVSWPGGATPAIEYGAALRALAESLIDAAESGESTDAA